MRPRVVVVHPPFGPYGGGELLAAWVLEAIAHDHDLTLVCIDAVDWARVDARFGTTLAGAAITVKTPSPAWQWILRVWPQRGDRLRWALIERIAARLGGPAAAAHWISTCNEMRLPRPGLQYVHFPSPDLCSDQELADRPLTLRRAYQRLCRRVAGVALAEHRRHVTLVNSHFTARAWRAARGVDAQVVYPPVPPLGAGRPWHARADRIVCLGRLFPGKGLERVVEIVAGARARGADVTLAIAGKWDCTPPERRRLEQYFRSRAWVEVHENLSRDALADLIGSSRYGMHGMIHEPFGIAVAELQDMGVITFVPATGGPPEIVEDERLHYRSEAEGVEQFLRVWGDVPLQEELRSRAARHAGRFSPGRFVEHVRAAVDGLRAGE